MSSKEKTTLLQAILKTLVEGENENNKENALRRLWGLSNSDEFKQLIVSPELQILFNLVRIVQQYHLAPPGSGILTNALGILWFVSRSQKRPLVDPELGLTELLVYYIENNSSYKDFAIKILSNCTIDNFTHEILLDESRSRYLYACRKELERDSNDRYIYQTFHCITTGIKESELYKLLKYNIHHLIVNRLLKVGSNPLVWPQRGNGPEYYGLTFLSNFSALPSGAEALEPLNILLFCRDMIKCNGMEKLKAAIIYVNICNTLSIKTDTVNGIHSFLADFPSILPFLILVLKVTISKGTDPCRFHLSGQFFHFGMVRLKTIWVFLRNLVLHEENRTKMLNDESLLPLLLLFLEHYANNEPELSVDGMIAKEYGGGGGEDHHTALLILEFFLIILNNCATKEERSRCLQDQEVMLIRLLNIIVTNPDCRLIPSDLIERVRMVLALLN